MKEKVAIPSLIRALFTVLGFYCLLAGSISVGRGEENGAMVSESETAVSDGTVDHYEAFPDVLRTPEGELILVYYAGPTHVGGYGVVTMTRSSDFGKTWTKPRVICSTPKGDNRDPCLVRTNEGTLLCTMMTLWDRSAPTAMEVRVIRSEDNGETWTEPKVVPSPFHKLTACSSPIVQLPGGDLLLPLYGRETENGRPSDKPGERDKTVIMRSSDDGKSWGEPVFIDDNPERQNQEPSLCLLPSGRVLCMMRNRGGIASSDDGGRTWSPIKYLNWDLDCPYLYPVSDQLILCGMRHRGHQPAITMTVSTDGGATWSEPLRMSDGTGAYPSIQRLLNDTFIFVYYRDDPQPGPSRIHRTYFQVAADGRITPIGPEQIVR